MVEGDKSRTNVTAYLEATSKGKGRKREEMAAGRGCDHLHMYTSQGCHHLHMYTSHTVLKFETMLILVVLKMERKSES